MLSSKCWNNKASDIKLVYLYSTIKMMHGPINLRWIKLSYACAQWQAVVDTVKDLAVPWKEKKNLFSVWLTTNSWRKSMFCGFISITHEMSLYLCSLKLSLARFMGDGGGDSVVIQLRYFVHIFEKDECTGYFLIPWNELLWINWLLSNKWFATAPRSFPLIP